VKLWRVLLSGFVAGGLCVPPLPAFAGWDTFLVAKTPSGVWDVQPSTRSMLKEAMGAGWLDTPVTGRTVNVGATGSVPVGAKSAGMRLGWGLTETAAGKLLARSIPVIGTATAAYEVAKAIRCYAAPGSSTFGGLIECDAGADPIQAPGYQASGYPVRSAAQAACNDAATSYLIGGRTVSVYVTPTQAAPSGMCRVYQSDGSFYLQLAITYVHNGSTSCPASVDPTDGTKSIPAGRAPGADGKCETARYNGAWAAASEATVAGKLAPLANANLKLDQIVRQALTDGGEAAEDYIRGQGTQGLTGPASVAGPTRTETPPGGGAAVTYNTTYNVTYNGSTFTYTETTSGSDGSGSSGPPVPVPVELETCGLPGKPACKIDETGTPTAPADTSATKATEVYAPVKAIADDPQAALPAHPELSWTFQLPTACGAFDLAAFAPFITSIDICAFQPMFHDLMSVVWVMGGAFGAIRMFFRNALSQG